MAFSTLYNPDLLNVSKAFWLDQQRQQRAAFVVHDISPAVDEERISIVNCRSL